MEQCKRIGYFVYFCFALTFLLTLHLRPYPLDYLVKSIPVFCLLIIVFFNVPGNKGKLLSIGFIFSGIGDILLQLDEGTHFVYGVGAFLLTHLFYIAVFLREPIFTVRRMIMVCVMVVFGIMIWALLRPKLGDMLLPVTIYLIVIVLMGISAILGKNNSPLIIIGACLFGVSDSIIAINRFLTLIYQSSLWIMITYYIAQFFIAFGAQRPVDES